MGMQISETECEFTERWCPRCPNRHLADLSRAVGEDELAAKIESGGCPDFWVELVEGKVIGRCGRETITRHLNKLASEQALVSETVQEYRNEVKKLQDSLNRIERALNDGVTLVDVSPVGWPRLPSTLTAGELPTHAQGQGTESPNEDPSTEPT